MYKIKEQDFIKGLVRKIPKGKAIIRVISIRLDKMPINQDGWSNIGVQKRKNGTEFLFDYDSYIKDQKKPEELLLDILNEDYGNPKCIDITKDDEGDSGEDYALESRKQENWNI